MMNEMARLRKLYQMELLDTPAERDFDEIVQLASQLAKTPISLITLLDTDRQWFKAKVGLNMPGTDRPSAVCNYTIQGDNLFEVEDLQADKRFENNALVKGGLKLRYYAGMPLITSDGHRLGALCVIDTKSRSKLSEEQAFALRVLARQAMNQIELRVKNRELSAIKTITDKLVGTVSKESEAAISRLKELILRLPAHIKESGLAQEIEEVCKTYHLADRTFANIIAWSKLQAVFDYKKMQHTRLGPVVSRCIDGIREAVASKGNTLTTDIQPESVLPAPADALCFILNNLLSNANKYTTNGQISVRYFTSGGGAGSSPRHYICVSDTGCGITESTIQQFNQTGELPIHSGTDGEAGQGHGLMLVRHVLHHLGGKLHLESSSGNYCNAIVIL